MIIMPDVTEAPREAERVQIAPLKSTRLPHDGLPESTFLLLRDGYRFVSKRCEHHGSDVFRTRLFLQNMVCMRGEAAARVFYDTDLVGRSGALPSRLRRTLWGEGSVQELDGEAHRARKQMFLSVLSPERVHDLVVLFERKWRETSDEWGRPGGVVLFDEAVELLFRSACEWSGVDIKQWEVEDRCSDLVAMIEGAGAVGPRHWQGRRARGRMEHWMAQKVERTRLGERDEEDERAMQVFSWYKDSDGTLPEKRVVAVELLNLLLGIVAVSYYVVLCARSLDAHPEWRRRLQQGAEGDMERFVGEVRRFYPLFPFVMGVVRQDFEWHGYWFQRGQRLMLDLYGTNHHPDSWGAPDKFHPDRFRDHEEDAFDFIPQGGGTPEASHRCAGEPATVELMKAAVRMLVAMEYSVPRQDLGVDLSCIPMNVTSGFLLENTAFEKAA